MTKRGKTVRRGRGRGRTQRRRRTYRRGGENAEATQKQHILDVMNKKKAEQEIIADTLKLYHNSNPKMHLTHHVNSNTEKSMLDKYNDLTEQIRELNGEYQEDFSGGRAQRRRRTN